MYIKCTNIDWDTDGKSPESLGIPNNVRIYRPTDEMIEAIIGDYNDSITNYLSDHYGFCVVSYKAEIIKAADNTAALK